MKKRTAILAGVLLLSMAFASVAYAHWTKIITMEGYVKTGRLHLTPTLTPVSLTQENKHVAYWGEWDGCGITDNRVYFELWNTYPCLDACVRLQIHNDGTIPAGFHSLTPIYVERWVEDAWVAFDDFDYQMSGDPESGYFITVWKPGSLPDPDPIWDKIMTITILLSDIDPPGGPLNPDYPHGWCQIDPQGLVIADICFHFFEGLWQGENFRFGLELEYWNWNEARCAPQ
jgi:hypothetical protein